MLSVKKATSHNKKDFLRYRMVLIVSTACILLHRFRWWLSFLLLFFHLFLRLWHTKTNVSSIIDLHKCAQVTVKIKDIKLIAITVKFHQRSMVKLAAKNDGRACVSGKRLGCLWFSQKEEARDILLLGNSGKRFWGSFKAASAFYMVAVKEKDCTITS